MPEETQISYIILTQNFIWETMHPTLVHFLTESLRMGVARFELGIPGKVLVKELVEIYEKTGEHPSFKGINVIERLARIRGTQVLHSECEENSLRYAFKDFCRSDCVLIPRDEAEVALFKVIADYCFSSHEVPR
jgi:hypothetical protein